MLEPVGPVVDSLINRLKVRPESMTEPEEQDPYELKRRRERRDHMIAAAGVTPRERLLTFETYRPKSPSQTRALEMAQALSNTGKGNLYFWGDRGIGKTHLAMSVINAHVEDKPVRFAPTNKFLLEVRRHMEATSEDEVIENCRRYAFFSLDDFGVQKITEWSLAFLDCLIDEWYRHGQSGLIMTSNFSLGHLATTISDRIASRIAGMCEVLKIEGPDQRTE